MNIRQNGILLHMTSLPSRFGIGDMGPGAYGFADFLYETRQSIWQILPLNPTDPIHHNSPYHSVSAFAANPMLISPEGLVAEGLLLEDEIADVPVLQEDRVDYEKVFDYKGRLLDKAFERFAGQNKGGIFEKFCQDNAHWLEDYALFIALKRKFNGAAWSSWPSELKDRSPAHLEQVGHELADQIKKEKVFQFLFDRQWIALKKYCRTKQIRFFGDLPIYVDYDSVDVWTHPEIFKLDENKRPYVVAGVPPDYFSDTGQFWGHPIYQWEALKETKYEWWMQRMAQNLKRYDILRIDHFRGLVAYWEIPAGEKNAVNGTWQAAPAWDFFEHMTKRFPCLPVVAEDLGFITPDVTRVMEHFGFPGMKLLLFAFDGEMPRHPYIPHNLPRNSIAYTGTHDNNTARGWFEKEADEKVRDRLFRYLGRKVSTEEIHWELIRLVMRSAANTAIFPMQDILGLGEEARMNRPAVAEGNWRWRLKAACLSAELRKTLRELTEIYGRA